MASRNRQHVIGDIASGRVQLVFLEAGWVVNTIPSDYGEDLLVSPTRDEIVDTFHLLVQVKGKDGDVTILRNGDWSRQFDATDVERWLRMRVPVVVALWSIEDNCGRFCWPRHQYRLSDLLDTIRTRKVKNPDGNPKVQLHFAEQNAVNVENLSRLAWEFRLSDAAETIELYENAYIEAIQELEEAEFSATIRSIRHRVAPDTVLLIKAKDKAKSEWDERRDEVLRYLGLLTPIGEGDARLIDAWDREGAEAIAANTSMEDGEVQQQFCASWLSQQIRDTHNVSIYSSLAETLADRLLELWPAGDGDPIDAASV